jgi:membrane fusion protein, multidrug efflux system
VRASQINLDYTQIRAPISGKISRTSMTIGNVVSPSLGALASIVSQDPMYVTFPIPVRTALDLRDKYADKGGFAAAVIKVRLPNGKIYGETGHLDYAAPSIATNTDTIMLRARIANPIRPGAKFGEPGDRELIDAEFVTVTVEGVQPVQALAIPRAAVLSDQQGSYVYVVDGEKKAMQRRIQLGQSTPETAVVMAGLKEGESVIADGIQRVRPGIVVSPAPFTPPPAAPKG